MANGILIQNFDSAQLFLGCNRYASATYTNSTGDTVTLPMGTLMGRVLATNKVLPHVSSATDGSEMPIGVLAQAVTVDDGDDAVVDICNYGTINKNLVTLGGSDTWSTAVRTAATGGGTIEDLVVRNTGLKLEATTELSGYDNQ